MVTIKKAGLARLAVSVLLSGGFVSAAVAQYQINQQVRMQIQNSGRMLDRNPSVYGGRFNTPSRSTVGPMMLGNLAASGQLRLGGSLRVGTIPSPTSFRGSLGSGALAGFRRDSVSTSYAGTSLSASPYIQPYFDPSTTVSSVGYLRGVAPSLTPYSYGITNTSPARTNLPSIERPAAANPFAPPRDPSLGTSSTIFSPSKPPPALLPDIEGLPDPTRPDTRRGDLPGMLPDTGRNFGQEDFRRRPSPLTPAQRRAQSPLDTLLGPDRRSRVGLVDGEAMLPLWMRDPTRSAERPGLIPPDPDQQAEQRPRPPGLTPRVADASLLPGHDVFTDMQLALNLESNPQAEWFEEMRAAAVESPELIDTPEELQEIGVDEFVDKMMKTPLTTFTGAGATAVNNLILKAEELMDVGHFYEAADRFRTAHSLAPGNPLPLIGRGHALLAAGDYRSAANSLLAGIERFPDITRFSMDLADLMGGGENVDIRRSDIMRRLEQKENPELRFLLGYLEYHTGMRERGLENLRRAAEHPLSTGTIYRYPKMLTGEGRLPPPQFDNLILPDDDESR